MDKVDFKFWDDVDKETFLGDDVANPARAFVAGVVRDVVEKIGPVTMAEVGPGPGIDYGLFYEAMIKNHDLVRYDMIEGSLGMAEHLQKKFPRAGVFHGTFADLPPASFDVVYTKALFEHQPVLEEPLRQFLAAARRVAIVNWYRPPAAQAVFDIVDNIVYATWLRDDVLRIGRECGWGEPEIYSGFLPQNNEVWIWRRPEPPKVAEKVKRVRVKK